MRSLVSRLSRLAPAAAALALLALTLPAAARAQTSPTPEGTVITNTATATYTDANNNSYASVNASATVTVGFLAGVDAVSPASVTPASPSTGNSLALTLKNIGNGTDTMSVAATSVAAGVTITGYQYNGTTYATVALLNTALGSVSVPAGGSLSVTVLYNVASGQGGTTMPVTLTQTSKRAPATSDPTTTNVQPPVAAGVGVAPKTGTPVGQLPSNGTQYSQVFPVTNNGNAQDSFTLTGAANPDLAIVSVNGTTGTSGGTITLAAGASQNVTVVYTVNTAAASGALDSLKLTATSSTNSASTDMGYVVVRVVRAAVAITKQAFKDDQATAIATTDKVLPGQYIQYKITVTNASGAATAQGVQVSDPLPAQVTYDSSSPDATGWTLAQASGTVTGSLSGTLTAGASRFFWIRVKVK